MSTQSVDTGSAVTAVNKAPVAYLNRRYRFSASHRLHVDALTEEQNRAAFGKCNNPFGHGHNYVVQVTFSGSLHPQTAMVADLAELDTFAATALTDFECANLNKLACFDGVVPSTENLSLELWRRFGAFTKAKLHRLRVEETGNNAFEYFGPDAPQGSAISARFS